jgi:16S rRNA (uracil1498-N3)-methyltransferase
LAAETTPALLYIPGALELGACIDLPPEEAHYVARVCRARIGEQVEATDGVGTLAALRILAVRGRVRAEVVSLRRVERRRRGWVLCGAPESERADWLVEKLAELGVERLIPVECARGRWRGGRRRRWERLTVAALRQSRRVHLLSIEEPMPFEEALAAIPGGLSRWLTDASGPGARAGGRAGEADAVGLVGPAGGLGAEERAAAIRAGFQPLRLSDARLRTETAAVAWAAWWSAGGYPARRAERRDGIESCEQD